MTTAFWEAWTCVFPLFLLSSSHTPKTCILDESGSSNLRFERTRVCLCCSLHSALNCPAGRGSSSPPPPPPRGLGLGAEMNGSLRYTRHTTQTSPKTTRRTKNRVKGPKKNKMPLRIRRAGSVYHVQQWDSDTPPPSGISASAIPL